MSFVTRLRGTAARFCCLAVAAIVAVGFAGGPRAFAQQTLYRNSLSAAQNTLGNVSGWSTSSTASGVTPTSVTAGDTLTFSNWWTPGKLSTAVWLDAADASTITLSGANVTVWSDKSGNARNATPGSFTGPTTTTVGSLPAVSFASQALNIPIAAAMGSNSAVLGVFQSSSTGGSSAGLINAANSGGTQEIRLGVGGDTNATYFNGGYVLNTAAAAYATRAVQGQTFASSGGNTTTALFRNGSEVASGARGTGSLFNDYNLFRIGNYYGGYRNGTVQELLTVQSAISTGDRQLVEGYLAWKWGLQSNLPANHPYKNAAPVSASETVYLGGNQSAAGLVFSGAASATTLLGGTSGGAAANTITVGAGGITVAAGAGAATLGAASGGTVGLVVGADQVWANHSASLLRAHNDIARAAGDTTSRTLTVAGTGDTRIDGSITDGGSSGSLALAKNGAGSLTLSGSNGYTGATTVSGGMLVVSDTASLPGWGVAGRLTVASGAGVAVGNGVSDASLATLLSTDSFQGDTTLGFDTSAGDRTYTESIGNTAQGSRGLVKLGANALTLSGSFTASGGVRVDGGTLNMGGKSLATAVTLASGTLADATLSGTVNVGSTAGFSAVTVNDGGLVVLGSGRSGSDLQTLMSGATFAGASLQAAVRAGVDTSGGDMVVAEPLSGTRELVKIGAGTLTLSASNSYSGGTTIQGGTVVASNDFALGTGPVAFAGGELQMAAGVALGGAMSLSGVTSVNAQDMQVEYLVVGGGGAGGKSGNEAGGGGGGGGAVLPGTMTPTELSYSVVVGSGGLGSSSTPATGGNSSFGDNIALGGGNGGGWGIASSSGGSGGGAGYGNGQAASLSAAVSPQLGNSGGAGITSGGYPGGGGGGAGAPGSAAAGNAAGGGGIGYASSISGASTYYGGGGGAGVWAGTLGTGGLGGGGNGSTSGVASSGTANTGGGGGGSTGGGGISNNGGNGGSGIVIVRYRGGQAATGGEVTSGTGTAAGYTVHTFTSTGTTSFVLNSAAGGSALAGNLTGSGGIAKTGNGTLLLSGSNSFSGDTTVGAGTLRLGNQHALGGSTFTGGAGTLDFGTLTAATFGGLGGSTNLALENASSQAVEITLGGSANVSFSGELFGAGGLTKTGAGTQVFSGVNTYSGATTISQGRLEIASAGRINGSSGVTISGGELKYNADTALTAPITFTSGILSGTGAIDSNLALVSTAAILSPGNSPGILSLGTSQTWSSYTYLWETNAFTGTTAGTDFDQIAISGSLALTGSSASAFVLDVTSLTAGNAAGNVGSFTNENRTWTILTTTGGITGFDPGQWQIQTTNFLSSPAWSGSWSVTQSGNDLMLNFLVVPEPGSLPLAGIGIAAVAWAARRRRAAR